MEELLSTKHERNFQFDEAVINHNNTHMQEHKNNRSHQHRNCSMTLVDESIVD